MAVMFIYERVNFGGASAQINRSYARLSEFWNDEITSIFERNKQKNKISILNETNLVYTNFNQLRKSLEISQI